MNNSFWEQLRTPAVLKAGWHLARHDARADLIHCPFYADVFTIAFDQNIAELISRLSTRTYHASPLTHVDVPKSTLAVRPGSVPEIEDRVVLQAIVRLLAPKADEKLPESVYSYRLKEKPTRDAIFKESDVLDIPYLKSKTISKYIDPFDSWYAVWPEFDEKSRATFVKDGFNYLVVTDIAAYFENIQLPILRDLLMTLFPDEQFVVNFLTNVLEGWTTSTDQGRNLHRGIPQGTQVSSFLGNIFLLPLDRELVRFCNEHEARYFRYMDDIRLFTKHYAHARKGLLQIDKIIRSLQLNTQSAKTEILSENLNQEITKRLIDSRLDDINYLIETVEQKQGKLSEKEKARFFDKLREIQRKKPFSEHESKLIGSKRPLKGLTLRVFRRWLTAHSKLGGKEYVNFLVRELKKNPDFRLTRKLVYFTRYFPRRSYFVGELFKFIKSDLNIFPHQWAEIIWSFRYLSKIPPYIIAHCKEEVLNQDQYHYVRIQAAWLLSRTIIDDEFLDKCRDAFSVATDPSIQIALALILAQRSGRHAGPMLRTLVFHPNDKVRKVGKLLREVRFEESEARKRLKFVSSSKNWVLCDYMAVLFSMSLSDRPQILKMLIKALDTPIKKSPRVDLKATLVVLRERARTRLAALVKMP